MKRILYKLYAFICPQWDLEEAFIALSESGYIIHAYYEIYYSPTRNKYKLKAGGDNPKMRREYPIVVKHLGELNQAARATKNFLEDNNLKVK